jgi:DNA integrity scanning protein DisA with diadenylate cyclase activity
MIESLIPAIVAIVTGTAVLFNKVNHRVTVLDQKVDKLELKLAESFTTKADFANAMERMEQHLIRIEDKMDKLVDKKYTT